MENDMHAPVARGLPDQSAREEAARTDIRLGQTIGGLRKTRLKGVARTQQLAHLTGAAYYLVRMSRLCTVAG
jgi:hypothetical protein